MRTEGVETRAAAAAAGLAARALAAGVLAAGLLGAGCGARSGLEIDALDAAPGDAAIDASIDTLPCRWTLGRALAVGAPADTQIVQIAAAADARRETVALRAGRGAGWVDPSFLVAPGDPPRAIAEVPEASEPAPVVRALFARDGGWLEIASSGALGCLARWRDESLGLVRTDRLADAPCGAHAIGDGEVALVVEGVPRGTARWSLSTLPLRVGAAPALRTELPTIPAAAPHAARGRDGAIVLLWRTLSSESVDGLAVLPDGGVVRTPGLLERASGGPVLAGDPLIGGVVALSRAPSGWRLDRVRARADGSALVVAPLLDVGPIADRIPADVSLVTNETEVLFALDDGRVVYVPLAGPDLRTIDAPPEGGNEHRVVLAEGRSFGGLAIGGDDGSGARLFFHTLVCNR